MDRIKENIKTIHMVGIAGSGMSGIAEILVSLGYKVQGSDLSLGKKKNSFEKLGVKTFTEHARYNIENADLIVYSGAIAENNIELVAASEKNIPILRRAEMLAELMNYRYGIAVSGSHGKTTTTSMISHILTYAGLDPTYVIGGKVGQFNSSAKLGKSRYLIVEADESDGSFLHMKPKIAVITNIDDDHLEHYGYSIEELSKGFRSFAKMTPFDGLIIANGDDERVRRALHSIGRKVLFYGENKNNHLQIKTYEVKSTISQIEFLYKDKLIANITLKLPGKHNAYNLAASIAVSLSIGIHEEVIRNAVFDFRGVDRRFQSIGVISIKEHEVLAYSDYAHHPTEINVTLKTAKEIYPEKDIILIFQPHRYSRMVMLKKRIAKSLASAHKILMLDIYGAGESDNYQVSALDIIKLIKEDHPEKCALLVAESDIELQILNNIEKDSILLFMGAGGIDLIAENFMEKDQRKICLA
jgi:UDP-N-acetylmuramate--alanine ligase